MPPTDSYRLTQLDNGVRFVTEAVPGMRSASVGVWVQSGSRHERPAEAGLSHFLEHLLFKGTERRSAREIAQAIEDVGGMLNAFTGKETTCYYAKVLDGDVPLAVDVLSDVFLNPTFPELEVERERGVIVQEILQGEDTPEDLVHDLFADHFWPGHSLGRPIAGTVASVEGLDATMLRRFRDERYLAERILIAAAGAVDHDALVDMLAEPFSTVGVGHDVPGETVPVPGAGVRIERKAMEQAHVLVGIPTVPHDHPDRHALQVLSVALGGGMSSRLFQCVREEHGRAYAVYAFLTALSDCGFMGTYAGTSPEWVPEVVGLIRQTVESVVRNPIRGAELERARNQLRANVLLGQESSDNRMSRLARSCLALGRPVDADELCSNLAGVTPEDVERVAASVVEHPGRCITILGDLDPATADVG